MRKVFLFILHTSLFHIYVRPHQMPFFSKICCSIGLNVPFHIKNASVKFQWNRFISRCSTKLLKNAFLLKKTKILDKWDRTDFIFGIWIIFDLNYFGLELFWIWIILDFSYFRFELYMIWIILELNLFGFE